MDLSTLLPSTLQPPRDTVVPERSAFMQSTGAEELYRQHAAWVARFLSRLGAEPQEIDDLVQEVFLVAHRRGGYLPGAASPRTWLAEIAQHARATASRTRRRRREQVDEGAVAAAVTRTASPYESAASTEGLARVQRFLEALSEEQRAVFVLFELEREPLAAIAAGLGVPLGTVCSRLDAARRAIRAGYEKLEAGSSRRGGAL